MSCFSRKKCTPELYPEFLRDGKVLAQVLEASCPTPLGQAKELSENPTDRERVEKLIYDLFDFGAQPFNLFEPDDLLKGRNIPQVNLVVYYEYDVFYHYFELLNMKPVLLLSLKYCLVISRI